MEPAITSDPFFERGEGLRLAIPSCMISSGDELIEGKAQCRSDAGKRDRSEAPPHTALELGESALIHIRLDRQPLLSKPTLTPEAADALTDRLRLISATCRGHGTSLPLMAAVMQEVGVRDRTVH